MIADDDPTARRLFEAVWADPPSDVPRMVLADYLLEHGDPMGEMIALQLGRARTGDPISERELELVVVHGRRMLGPVNIWLSRWVFERGCLVAATPLGDAIAVAAAQHPLWSTVERIQLNSGAWHNVLDNPRLVSLRALHLTAAVAFELAQRSEPLPIRALTGAMPHMGLRLEDDRLDVFEHRGAFANVRALSLDAWRLERALNARPVLESPLIAQLEHLDLTFASVRLDDLRLWRRWAFTTALARFSIQVPLASARTEDEWNTARAANHLYVELDRGRDDVIVQLHEPTAPELVADALAVIGEVAAERTAVIVEDTRDSNRAAERHAALLEALRRRFASVVVAGGPVRVRAP